MSREYLAKLLEVKIDATVTTPEAKEAKYQAAAKAYFEGSTLEAGKVEAALAIRAQEKMLLIDPTSSEPKKELNIVLADGTPKIITVIGLQGKEGSELLVLQEIYSAIGDGYTVFFSDIDDDCSEGAAADFKKKDVGGILENVPKNFKGHVSRLQAFSGYVQSQGGLDKVDVAAETWPGTTRNGSLYDKADTERDNAKAILAAYYGLARIEAKLGEIRSKLNSLSSQDRTARSNTLEAIIALTAAVDKETQRAEAKIPKKPIAFDGYAKSERDKFAELDRLRGELTAESDKSVLDFIAGIESEANTLMRSIKSAEDISTLELASAISAEEKNLKAVKALIESAQKVLSVYDKPNPLLQIAAFQRLQEDHQSREAALVAAKRHLEERAEAGAPEGDSKVAHEDQNRESATDHLLKAGFYSKDKDLSHVFAEKGLEAFKGRVDPATQSQYAGAFILPGVGDTTGASLNPLAEALTAAKQKIDAADGTEGKIALPVTLRFLMHAPDSPTGHETVLDVAVAAGATGNKVVTVTQFDSLLPVDSLLPETKTALPAALPAALLGRITTAFGTGYDVAEAISQNPNPIGQQAGVECVYFAVAEIAKGYTTTLASITPLADAAGKANMKLAVTKLMADAVQSEYMLADDGKAALSEPPKTVCVNPGDLRLATEGDAKKYNTVPGLENLKAGDIIYPVVLENKRLAYEISQRATAAKGGVKALQADMAFITLCRELIQNNTPSEPDLNGLNDVAQRVLVELIVMNAHRQAITTAVPQAVGTITTADRANVQDQVKSAVTPFDLENKALEALKKGEAGRELLKGFSSVVKAAQEDCQKRLATLASTKGDADKKESAADSKKAKTTTTAEGGDAFKDLDEAARKKVMFSLCGEMKETFKLPPRSQFQKVEFEVVKQTNKQTGKQEDQISVVKTADTDECRVTLSVTVTKIGKTQAEKPVDVTLVRTVTGEKVERKCETTSDLVDWKTQCALMAAASISDRKKAAELQSTPDKKVEPDLNIRVSILDNSPQVKGQLIGGKSTDKLTRDEAIMIQAYLDAGYTRVQCQGMDFYPAGTTKASSYAVAEAKLSPVLSAGGDPDHKLPNVAATAPTKEERPQDKKGLFLDIVIPFRNKATPQGLDNVQQARAILKNARELHGKGYRFVGITYSANQAETAAIRAAYDKKPTPVDITGATKGGAKQAEVMVEVERLLAKSRASGGYDDLQGIFRIVPITTMSAGGAAPVTGDHDTAASLEAAKAFVQEGGALLGWQNQNGASRGVYAVGGGVATKAFASAEGDVPEIAASKKALEEAYGVRQKMIQSALANLKKEYSPVSSETATATL